MSSANDFMAQHDGTSIPAWRKEKGSMQNELLLLRDPSLQITHSTALIFTYHLPECSHRATIMVQRRRLQNVLRSTHESSS